MLILKRITILIVCASMIGCASIPAGSERSPDDPWEPFNRSVFSFNESLDDYLLKPIDEELLILKEVSEAVFHGEISLGIGVDWLEAETGRKMSRPGLKKHVDKVYGRLDKKS